MSTAENVPVQHGPDKSRDYHETDTARCLHDSAIRESHDAIPKAQESADSANKDDPADEKQEVAPSDHVLAAFIVHERCRSVGERKRVRGG